MRPSRTIIYIALVSLIAACKAPEKKVETFNPDELLEEEKSAWQEMKAALPGYPKADSLVEVRAGPLSSHRYYIDAASVSLGKDGVMRYSVVVKTAGGATNVSFEGIRCQTRERKMYAVGHSDGTWREARDPAWRDITRTDLPVYLSLYSDYFCPSRTIPTPPRQAIDAIRRGTPLTTGPT